MRGCESGSDASALQKTFESTAFLWSARAKLSLWPRWTPSPVAVQPKGRGFCWLPGGDLSGFGRVARRLASTLAPPKCPLLEASLELDLVRDLLDVLVAASREIGDDEVVLGHLGRSFYDGGDGV